MWYLNWLLEFTALYQLIDEIENIQVINNEYGTDYREFYSLQDLGSVTKLGVHCLVRSDTWNLFLVTVADSVKLSTHLHLFLPYSMRELSLCDGYVFVVWCLGTGAISTCAHKHTNLYMTNVCRLIEYVDSCPECMIVSRLNDEILGLNSAQGTDIS